VLGMPQGPTSHLLQTLHRVPFQGPWPTVPQHVKCLMNCV
jgi:hypothetical protein